VTAAGAGTGPAGGALGGALVRPFRVRAPGAGGGTCLPGRFPFAASYGRVMMPAVPPSPTARGSNLMTPSRRAFLADVGRGALVASVGPTLAADLGLSSARAAEARDELTFGKLEPLVCLMQETAADRLLPALVKKVQDGADLKELVAAAALANARNF